MQTHRSWTQVAQSVVGALAFALASAALMAQVPSAPNPYRWDESWKPQLPDGRTWGSSAGVGIDRSGNIYVAERCGGNPLGCAGKTIDTSVKLSPTGKFLGGFGGARFIPPYGLYVDLDGTMWTTN